MKTKTIITIALLVFVVASIGYLITKELRALAQSAPDETYSPPVINDKETTSEDANAVKSPVESSQKVVFYYFHGTTRCPTCRKFEAFSREALQQMFRDELEDGRLKWQVVNVDKPGNGHFVTDYQLHTRAIVISKIKDGKQTGWKNLDKIWELVGDKAVFVKYVQDEVAMYLGAS